MILYNTTFVVSQDKVDKFRLHLKNSFIPAIMAEEVIISSQLFQLHSEHVEKGDVMYALHLYSHHTKEEVERYTAEKIPTHISILSREMGSQILFFSSILEEDIL